MRERFSKRLGKWSIYFPVVCSCWVGFEYLLEGVVHSSIVDSLVAVLVTYLLIAKKEAENALKARERE